MKIIIYSNSWSYIHRSTFFCRILLLHMKRKIFIT